MHYGFQILVTFVVDREEKEKNRIKQKLLETSRVLYLFVIASTTFLTQPSSRSTRPSTSARTRPS